MMELGLFLFLHRRGIIDDHEHENIGGKGNEFYPTSSHEREKLGEQDGNEHGNAEKPVGF